MNALVRQGLTLAEHGVVRWRKINLSRQLKARFGVHLAERSVGDLLRRLGFRRLSTRPRHPSHDAEAQEAHKDATEPDSERSLVIQFLQQGRHMNYKPALLLPSDLGGRSGDLSVAALQDWLARL